MDWGNVTTDELLEALREVEWSTPPRPLTEFFQRFTSPKNQTKWSSRVKCNVYYYRTNYYGVIVLVLACGFFRNPLALASVLLASFSIACLNDSFALAISERLTRGVRRLSPPLAAKLRPPSARSSTRGRPLKSPVHIAGQDRRLVVGALLLVSLLLWYLASALLTALLALLIALMLIGLHTTFRSPNLKARLNTFREEFRAVWRGYSDAP